MLKGEHPSDWDPAEVERIGRRNRRQRRIMVMATCALVGAIGFYAVAVVVGMSYATFPG
jgi:hypothetical protein